MRVLGRSEIEALLPMAECIEVVAEALSTLARGDAVLPLRTMTWLPDRRGMIGLMPGYLGAPRAFGLKVVSVFPENHGTGLDSHQGVVMLVSPDRGQPLAVLDAASITAIRTAAASGVATRALARPDAGDLAILGSGVQARSHLDAMRAVRPLRRVRVWSRTSGHAERFARSATERTGIAVEAVAHARDAVRGADLVCTTTAAREPVLEGAWLSPGAHVNAVGACFAAARELDAEAVRRARLYVDRRESALAESGDFLLARAEGAVGDDHLIGELGELLTGQVAGRRSPDEITLFESLGIAVEDLGAAHRVLAKAEALGVGTVVDLDA